MKAFEWTNPANINEAVKMLGGSAGDIDEAPRPIAGGQDLLTTMKDYTSRPVRVVNLKNIRGLNQIKVSGRGLTIGALVTLSELEEHALQVAGETGCNKHPQRCTDAGQRQALSKNSGEHT